MCTSEDKGNLVEEKVEVDPWELPEFTHTTTPWRGIAVTLRFIAMIALVDYD